MLWHVAERGTVGNDILVLDKLLPGVQYFLGRLHEIVESLVAVLTKQNTAFVLPAVGSSARLLNAHEQTVKGYDADG